MTIKQKVPVNFVVSFFKIEFKDHPHLFFDMSIMQHFLQGENTINNMSPLNKSILLDTKQLMGVFAHSNIHSFGDKFIGTS